MVPTLQDMDGRGSPGVVRGGCFAQENSRRWLRLIDRRESQGLGRWTREDGDVKQVGRTGRQRRQGFFGGGKESGEEAGRGNGRLGKVLGDVFGVAAHDDGAGGRGRKCDTLRLCISSETFETSL